MPFVAPPFHRRDAEARSKRRDLDREHAHAWLISCAGVPVAEEAETLRTDGRAIPSPIPHLLSPGGPPQEAR
jgi:hypothetical protein